jgi:hypothetical protein
LTKAKKTGSGESSPRRHGISAITEPTAAELTERQISDYRTHREKFIKWVLNLGKDPERGEGYAQTTADVCCARVDNFYRWVWGQENDYTTYPSHEHADRHMPELACSDASKDTKANMMKALKTLFRWRVWAFGDAEWEPELTFSNDNNTTNPRDCFSVEERQLLREAVLNYGSVPSYNSLSPEEREEWKIYLAQRFVKHKVDIGPNDFDRANLSRPLERKTVD